ncbi:hypothetical protein MAR_028491, partial [Mya arenaria]
MSTSTSWSWAIFACGSGALGVVSYFGIGRRVPGADTGTAGIGMPGETRETPETCAGAFDERLETSRDDKSVNKEARKVRGPEVGEDVVMVTVHTLRDERRARRFHLDTTMQ